MCTVQLSHPIERSTNYAQNLGSQLRWYLLQCLRMLKTLSAVVAPYIITVQDCLPYDWLYTIAVHK